MQHAVSFAACSRPGADGGRVSGDETWMDFVNLVRAEYAEMPGLSLSAAQVQRLWNLDPDATGGVLTYLVQTGFLHCTPRGTYLRAR